MPNKTCPCADPPGGSITCRGDQMAVCGMVDSKIVSGCYDPPDSPAGISYQMRQVQLANWALSLITSPYRQLTSIVTPEERQILREGTYSDPLRLTDVRFSIPRDLDLSELPPITPSSAPYNPPEGPITA